MNKIIADQQQRQQAISAEVSYIVRAPAGSGKTELLIQRYLRLLSLVDAPEEIIAITFTRKAAAEMQSRILDALLRASEDDEPEAEHARQTWHLARAALKRDEKFDWNLQQSPSRLKIQTIDSLCAALTRQMPLLSGLGANPETVENATRLYEQAAINTLAELNTDTHWSESIARLLTHLDNDLLLVKRLLMNMLAKRDQWLRHVAIEHQREDLESALQWVIVEKLIQLKQTLPVEMERELCEVAAFAALNLEQSDPDHQITHCRFMTEYPGVAIEDLNRWSGLCELLLTAKGEWRKRLNVKNGFPSPSSNKAESEIRTRMKQLVEAQIQRLASVPELNNLLNDVRKLPPPHYCDDEWEVVAALCQLLKLAEAQLQLLFAERNQTDFTGVAHAASRALGNEEEPADLALQLDYQIKHILVDEYQDISVNQFTLLHRLTAAWTEGDGRTLFLVGDPMQSIYRFREAEVGLFLDNWRNCSLGQIRLTPLTLSTNFRSQPGLVEWVNSTFTRLLPFNEDVTTGAVSYEPSTAYHNVQPMCSVTVVPAYSTEAEIEAVQLLERLSLLKKNNPEDSIAILVRSRRHLLQIIPALRNADISFQAVDIEGLTHRSEVQDVLALIRAVSNLADRTAWLAILRAPWCGLSLEALLILAGEETSTTTIWERLQDPEVCKRLDADSQEKTGKFVSVMSNAERYMRIWNLHKVVESLWLQLGGAACLKEPHQFDNIRVILDYLAESTQGELLPDTGRWISDIESQFATAQVKTDNPVQLMTIHKSKGLEFDHVILPGLGRKTRNIMPELLLWMQLPQRQHASDLILAPIRETGKKQALIYDYVNSIEKIKQQHEDSRLLYVAVTRAKKSLQLYGHARLKEEEQTERCVPSTGSFLHKLWPVVSSEFESGLQNNNEQHSGPVETLVRQEWSRIRTNWVLSMPPVISHWKDQSEINSLNETRHEIEFEWAGELIKHIGSVVHQAIQYIAEDGLEKWNQEKVMAMRSWYASQLMQLGVNIVEVDRASDDVCSALISMLDDNRGRWVIGGEHVQAQNEYAMSGLIDDRLVHVRIDRTFIDEQGTRWIIDYKTSRHESADVEHFLDQEQERYRYQLERYARLMQGQETRPIKLGLYFPLLQGWRSWDMEAPKTCQ